MFATQVFHAGTALNASGQLVSNGGRVLNVTALGKDVAEAQANAYKVRRPARFADLEQGPSRMGRADHHDQRAAIQRCGAAQAVSLVDWEDAYYRKDIGWRAIARLAGAGR